MLVVTALVLGAMATLAAGQVKIGPTVKAAGVGTAAAKNAPYCDPKDGKLAYPYQQRAPCVAPMAKGANNGGATYQGVTKDAIKIVVVVPTHDQQVTARTQPGVSCTTPNRETGACADIEATYPDWQAVLTQNFQLWGRALEFEFFHPTGAGEAEQRADALTVISMKPFGVVCNGGTAGGGRIFGLAVAQAKIMAFNCGGTNSDAVAQAPYVWLGGFDSDASAVNGAEVLGKMFVGKPAEYSGNAADKTKTRVVGVIKPQTGPQLRRVPEAAQAVRREERRREDRGHLHGADRHVGRPDLEPGARRRRSLPSSRTKASPPSSPSRARR